MRPFSAVGSFQSSKSNSCCYRQLPTTVANYVEFMCTVVALCGLWLVVQATPFNKDQLLQDAQDAFRRSSWYIFNISIVCSFISWAGLAAQSEFSAEKGSKHWRNMLEDLRVCVVGSAPAGPSLRHLALEPGDPEKRGRPPLPLQSRPSHPNNQTSYSDILTS